MIPFCVCGWVHAEQRTWGESDDDGGNALVLPMLPHVVPVMQHKVPCLPKSERCDWTRGVEFSLVVPVLANEIISILQSECV